MKRRILSLALLFGMGQANATGVDDIAGLYAECAAYYTLVYHAVNNAGEAETAAGYAKAMDNAMFYSLLLTSTSRDKDMAVNVTSSRIEMYIKQMKEMTNNDNANISILINKHNFTCQDAMENLPVELVRILKHRTKETQ